MTDRMRSRFEDIATRVDDGTPDLATVVEAGRRARLRRRLATTVGTVGLAALLVVAVSNLDLPRNDDASLRPSTHDDGVFVPADPGEPTYILTDFEIRYPYAKVDGMPGMRPGSERREQYCSMPEREEHCESEGNAGLFYEWEWSTNQFPGVVACQAVLYSKEGELVGHTNWELSGLEPTSRRPADVLIHVTDKPERAEAFCEAGTIESGPTHRFTYLRSEVYNSNPRPEAEPQYRYRLLFQVETLTEHSTGMCRLTVRYESGKKLSNSFTMTGAPRADEEFELGAPYKRGDPVKNATVRCRTYKRELQD